MPTTEQVEEERSESKTKRGATPPYALFYIHDLLER